MKVARATFLLFKWNSSPLHSTGKLRRQKKKVACATFLLFKLNSSPLHSTWKLRRQKKKVARATFLLFKLNSFPLHSTWELRRQKSCARQRKLNGKPPLVMQIQFSLVVHTDNDVQGKRLNYQISD